MKRLFIRTSDIEELEGVGRSQAWRILREIKEKLNKGAKAKITIDEYCDYREVENRQELRKILNIQA